MAGQRINIMEVRTLISLKQKGWSNRKIAVHIKVNRKTVDSYISRFRALELSCEELLQFAYIQKLLLQYSYPEIAYKQCQGILSLGRDYTPGRLEKACQRALNHDKASYHTIERILKSGLDQAEELPFEQSHIPIHSNIRGAGEYR